MYQYKEIKQEEDKRKSVKINRTGIPEQLKRKVESSSGLLLDDVRIIYNSDRPARLDAAAYTQGNRVYIGPGQERYLSHELGHVLQQKEGLVQAKARSGSSVRINEDPVLERQADEIGAGRRVYFVRQEQSLYSVSAPVQLARGSNPFNQNRERTMIAGKEQTGHHIIPVALIKAAFSLLEEAQKKELKWLAGVPWYRQVQTERGGRQETGYDFDRAEMERRDTEGFSEADYIEWPQGNIFYGLNTDLRAEAGKKDGFDYDARYIKNVEKGKFLRLRDCYHNMEDILSMFQKYQDEEKRLMARLKKCKNGERVALNEKLSERQAESERVLLAIRPQLFAELRCFYEMTALKEQRTKEESVQGKVLAEGGGQEAEAPAEQPEQERIRLQEAAESGASEWVIIEDNAVVQSIAKHRKNVSLYYRKYGFVCLPRRLVTYVDALEKMNNLRQRMNFIIRCEEELEEKIIALAGQFESDNSLRNVPLRMLQADYEKIKIWIGKKAIVLNDRYLEEQAGNLADECDLIISTYENTSGYYDNAYRMVTAAQEIVSEYLARQEEETNSEQKQIGSEPLQIKEKYTEMKNELEQIANLLRHNRGIRETQQQEILDSAMRNKKIFLSFA